MREKVVIWGASGHALVVADILRLEGKYEILGLLDDVNRERHGSRVNGLKILGGQEQLDGLKQNGATHVIIGIGDCSARMRLANLAEEKGFQLAQAIHPRAVIATGAEIGRGTVIAAGVVVNPGAKIGANVIVNTGATVDHECTIAEGVHVGPGVHLGGLVNVKEGAWIGIGANVLDRITIGAHSIVGAGSVVTKNVLPEVVAYGSPARVVRTIHERKSRAKHLSQGN